LLPKRFVLLRHISKRGTHPSKRVKTLFNLPDIDKLKGKDKRDFKKTQIFPETQTPVLSDIDRKSMLEDNKVVVYKKSQNINGKELIIEISRSVTNSNKQSVTAYSLLDDKKYYIEIPTNVWGNADIYADIIVSNLTLRKGKLYIAPYWKSSHTHKAN